MNVHPVADLFPMLADDELKELAEDIKQRGLLQPIVLDAEGRVLDGRNRLVACEMVDIEPSFVTYDGDDPDGYALSVNIARRHLTKGQQAMVAAKARLVSKQDIRSVAKQSGLNAGRVGQAATVVEHAPDLVDAVIAGAMGLDKAYEVARQRKTEADSVESQLARLRAEDSDLADRVVEGELSLKGAWAELGERQKKRADEQRDARALLKRVVELVAPEAASEEFLVTWVERLGELDTDLTVLAKRAEKASQIMNDLVERLRR
jgi:hypothetical protein